MTHILQLLSIGVGTGRAGGTNNVDTEFIQLSCAEKMGQLTVSVVTFLTVPASVVARTSMSGRSEDRDSLMPQPVKK